MQPKKARKLRTKNEIVRSYALMKQAESGRISGKEGSDTNLSVTRTGHLFSEPKGESTLKIIALDRFKPGVTMETITPLLPEEAANAWRLWKAGIVRENYARLDEPGVVIVFECADVAEAKRYLDGFPMTKAGYIEWDCIPAPLPSQSKACSTLLSMCPSHSIEPRGEFVFRKVRQNSCTAQSTVRLLSHLVLRLQLLYGGV